MEDSVTKCLPSGAKETSATFMATSVMGVITPFGDTLYKALRTRESRSAVK